MTFEDEVTQARAEMIFREEQLHTPCPADGSKIISCPAHEKYDAARDRYLALLAEDRIRKLREVTA